MNLSKKFKTKSFYTSLGLFTLFVLMQLTTWLPLRFWGIWGGGNFIDSHQILQWSNCYKTQGNTIFQNYGECPGYIYGSTLMRILSPLDFTPSSAQIFGYTFMFLLALTVSHQVGNFETYRKNPYLLAIVLSPPILLLAERGNFDILMLVLVALAGLLLTKNHHSWALLPLALATLLKFYTLPLFLLFFIINDNNRRKLLTLIIGLSVSVRVFLDLQLIQSTFPSGDWAKFGVSIWTRYLEVVNVSDHGEAIANISGAFIFVFIFAFTTIVLKRLGISISSEVKGDSKDKIYFYLFFGTHLACYFFGMNYEYRLVFFVVASIIYLQSFVSKKDLLHKVVLVLTILSVWLTYPSSGLTPIGDLAIEIATIILGIQFIQLLKLDLKIRKSELRLRRSS
jgi:hypothetical protein